MGPDNVSSLADLGFYYEMEAVSRRSEHRADMIPKWVRAEAGDLPGS